MRLEMCLKASGWTTWRMATAFTRILKAAVTKDTGSKISTTVKEWKNGQMEHDTREITKME